MDYVGNKLHDVWKGYPYKTNILYRGPQTLFDFVSCFGKKHIPIDSYERKMSPGKVRLPVNALAGIPQAQRQF